MIKHIVFFKLTGMHKSEEKEEACRELKKIFESLADLSCVDEYRVGINISNSENAWDLVIDSSFKSPEDLEEYSKGEEHIEAIRRARQFEKEKSVINYIY